MLRFALSAHKFIELHLCVLVSLLLALPGLASAQNYLSLFRSNGSDLVELSRSKASCCGAKAGAAAFSPLSIPEYETYKLTATYYSLRDELTTTLMLNNKGSEPILAWPTIYSLSGTRLQLAPITVGAASYLDVDLHELLSGAGDEFREGSIKIAYEGGSMQLGAQVRMVDSDDDLIWAEQFVYTSKFTSSRLENVWWLPYENSKTRVAVSNTSGSAVVATITVDGTEPHQSSPTQIALAPWETRLLEIMSDLVGHPNGNVKEKGGISITHTGNPGAVLARMFISKPNRGYSAAVSFIDPETTASQRWHGSGLRLKNLNGTKVEPVLAVRNTGEQLSRVQGRIVYTLPDGSTSTISLPQWPIAPGATRVINLDNLIENANVPNAVSYGGIELEYDTPKGSIITSVQSVSQNGDHVFQVPMFDPQNMPSSAGGFPWKADGDYRTLVYLKNETDTPKRYTAHLAYEGGRYSIGVKELKPGETAALDFREIRDSQTPDSKGNIIPLNVDKGQIAWTAKGAENKVLSGRSEQISLTEGVASTYACYNCCPNSTYETWIDPSSASIVLGASMSFIANETELNCYGQVFGPYEPSSVSWNSSNWNVASVGPGGYTTGVGVGNAVIWAYWEGVLWFQWEDGYCEPWPQNIERYSLMEVTPPSVQINEVGFTGDHQITRWSDSVVIDNPDGSMPTWKSTSPNPNHPVAYTKGATVTMFAKFGINPSIPSISAKIRVKTGSTVIANKDISLSGTSVTITGISTTSALENTVKTTMPTFTWEISYNGGSSWSSIGNSGSHTIHWTYATPKDDPFQSFGGTTYSPLYDLALEHACGAANGANDVATIVGQINQEAATGTFYNPARLLVGHPLNAYTNQCLCADLAALLRGLIRSIGIDGSVQYIWAGPNATTEKLFIEGNAGDQGEFNPSFRIIRNGVDGAPTNPHFAYHAVVPVGGTWYDPSYGLSYSSLSFDETAFMNTPQQTSTTFPAFATQSGWVCPLH